MWNTKAKTKIKLVWLRLARNEFLSSRFAFILNSAFGPEKRKPRQNGKCKFQIAIAFAKILTANFTCLGEANFFGDDFVEVFVDRELWNRI